MPPPWGFGAAILAAFRTSGLVVLPLPARLLLQGNAKRCLRAPRGRQSIASGREPLGRWREALETERMPRERRHAARRSDCDRYSAQVSMTRACWTSVI